MIFTIFHKEGYPLVELDIEYEPSTPYPVKMGLAVQSAIKTDIPLDGANLAGVICSGMNLDEGSFKEAVLDGGQFNKTSLVRTRFDNASLHCANFEGASFKDTIFDGADLSCAIGLID